MKLAVLSSGGKDSLYAAWLASKKYKLCCVVSLQSENEESYMFHVPNVALTLVQAKAMGLPIVFKRTEGEKEAELKDLREALKEAKQEFSADGVVCGAIASEYQRKRVAKVCKELKLKLLAPLWGVEPYRYLKNLIRNKFKVIIVEVAAAGLGEEFLGRKLNSQLLKKLLTVHKKYKIHIAGEGGEYETLVLACPLFKRQIKVEETKIEWHGNSGVLRIERIRSLGKR